MITEPILKQIMPNTPKKKRSEYLPFINEAMKEFDITTELRAAAFLAQLAHESGELRYMEEIASGEAYEGRKDLGNVNPGDGKRYKGRGPIQLTGRSNYKLYGTILHLNLEGNPEIAATKEVGFRIAALFWKSNGLNELADKRKYKAITKRINGGYNGLEDRIKYYDRALLAIPDDFNMGGFEPPPDEENPDIIDKSAGENGKDKGVSTSPETKKEDSEGVPPPSPAVEVKASTPSWFSRISAFSIPTGAVGLLAAIGKFLVTLPPWVWAIVIPSAILASAYLINGSLNRANMRTLKVMDAGADQEKNNLRLV